MSSKYRPASGCVGKILVAIIGFCWMTAAVPVMASQGAGNQYYVDINRGDDANDGSAETPWKTLHYAFGVTSPVAENDTVYVLPGYYSNYSEGNEQLTINVPNVSLIGFCWPSISGNMTGDWTTGIVIADGIDGVTIEGFEITGFVKGIYAAGSSPTIRRNKIHNNTKGIEIASLAPNPISPRIENNLIYYCTEGIFLTSAYGGVPEIYHNTIDSGDLYGPTAGIHLVGHNVNVLAPQIKYNIIGNFFNIEDSGIGIYNALAVPDMDYNCFFHNNANYSGGVPGTHALLEDPQYLDPVNADYHLSYASHCINIIPDTTFDSVAMDLDGKVRPIFIPGIDNAPYVGGVSGGLYDMGAYEKPADADLDGLDYLAEINNVSGPLDPENPDTDGDGYYDSEEIQMGTNPDNIEDFPQYSPNMYYVNANAGTLGLGTEADPWQTLHHAIHHINNGTSGNYTLIVAAGIYSRLCGCKGHEPDAPLLILQDNVAIQGAGIGQTVIEGGCYTSGSSETWVNGFDIEEASQVTLRNMEIRGFGGSGIHLGSANNCVIEACSIHDNNLNGITIEYGFGSIPPPSFNNIIRNGCDIYRNKWVGISINESYGNQIKNNMGPMSAIHDNGDWYYGGGIGIEIAGPNSADNLIENNRIYNAATNTGSGYYQRTGIFLADTGSAGNTIQHNFISGHTNNGVEIQTANAQISRNLFVDNITGINVTAFGSTANVSIWNNLIYEDAGTPDFIVNYGIYSNTQSGGRVISTIKHNTIDGGQIDGIHLEEYGLDVSALIMANIITNFHGYGINNVGGAGSVTLSNNDVWNITGTNYSPDIFAGPEDLSEDPKYVGPADYHLQGDSGCIDSVQVYTGVTDDLDGISRPQGDNQDMGCYEFYSGIIDSDNDGIPNKVEDANHNSFLDPGETGPFNPDTDGDGYHDGEEVAMGSDPTDPNYIPTYWPGEYWVNSNPDLLGYGNTDNPWNTLHMAIHHINNGMPGDYTLHILAGTYNVTMYGGKEPDAPLDIRLNTIPLPGSLTIIGHETTTDKVLINGMGAYFWQYGFNVQSANVSFIDIDEIRGFTKGIYASCSDASAMIIAGSGIHNNSYGIYMSNGANDNIIQDCAITDNGTHGVHIDGGCDHITIQDNCDIFRNGSAGIYAADSSNVQIFNNANSISDNGYSSGGGGAGIYCVNCTNVNIFRNRILWTGDPDYPQPMGIDLVNCHHIIGGPPLQIAENEIYNHSDPDAGFGIRIVDSRPSVMRNVLYDNLYNIFAVSNTLDVDGPPDIWNNLIYNGPANVAIFGIWIRMDDSDGLGKVTPTLYHNTIDGMRDDAINIYSSPADSGGPIIQFNNLTRFAGSGITRDNSLDSGPLDFIEYNNVWSEDIGTSGSNYINCSGGTGSISTDPAYVFGTFGNNYHLQAASLCIDTIPDSGLDWQDDVSDDLDKMPRPFNVIGVNNGGVFDMGCYEYSETLLDSDGDGLPDVIEPGSCPFVNDPDSDDDGLLDGQEDANHDGILDPGETDPCYWDTDRDGILDGTEDANHDGVLDSGETDPLNPDTDGDGYTDGEEVAMGSDPTNTNPDIPDTPTYLSGEYWVDPNLDMLGYGTAADPWNSLHLAIHHINNGGVVGGAYVLHVLAGTYKVYYQGGKEPNEELVINLMPDASLTLQGAGQGSTFIDGYNCDNWIYGFTNQSSNVSFVNLEILNFYKGIYVPGAGAENLNITDCAIHNTTYGVYFHNGANTAFINNCDIHHNAEDGVRMYGGCSNIIIQNNCQIHDNNQCGVIISDNCSDIKIRNGCEILRNGWAGIYAQDSSHIEIANNAASIADNGFETGFGYGGIYCNHCTGVNIHHNRINWNEDDAHKQFVGIFMAYCYDAVDNYNLISDNEIYNHYAAVDSSGIYLSNSQVYIDRNIFYDNYTGIDVESFSDDTAGPRNIWNNLIYNGPENGATKGIIIYMDGNKDVTPTIYHNTIDGMRTTAIDVSAEFTPIFVHGPLIQFNNLTQFVENGINNHGDPTQLSILRYNNVWSSEPLSVGYVNCSGDVDTSISADPLYVSTGAQNFRLQAASPCIDTIPEGLASYPDDVNGDLDLNLRPQPNASDGKNDMGCYEVLQAVIISHAIPDTGQTSCYNDMAAIFCPEPGAPFYGQDFQYQPQHPRSYTKLGTNGVELPGDAPQPEWLMTRDNVTGLIWEIKTVDNMNDKYTWDNASAVFIAGLNAGEFGGFHDWRVPTIKELISVIHSGVSEPTIDIQWFPNAVSSDVWSSTANAGNPGYAWYVGFNFGYVYITDKSYANYVIAVRGGQSGIFNDSVVAGRLLDNGDGTVTDTALGLMWEQTAAPVEYNWENALAYAEDLELAGHDDWRIPTRNELITPVDYTRYNPAIDPAYFFGQPYSYWTSTTGLPTMNSAWRVYRDLGDVGTETKSSEAGYVRAVRGGQVGSVGGLAIHGPTQGDRYAMGENLPIIWDPAGLGDAVKIFLSRDGGSSWEEIIASTPNDGNAGWTITGSATANAMLRIEDAAAPGVYQEIGFFSLGTVYNLFVTTTGTGSGSVTTIPAIINCPETSCTGVFPEDTMIQISAVAEPGSTFVGWFDGTGSAVGCSGNASCSFSITETSSIKAQFDSTIDFGDAPDPTYPTLLANDGARHIIASGGIYLGNGIDDEPEGQPDPDAMGDDNSGSDDEDGVVFNAILFLCDQIPATITVSTAGYIDAWIDFNNDGDWADTGEQIFASLAVNTGPNNVNFTIPCNATPGKTFARFRFSSMGGLTYTGLAADGEVEDYAVEIFTPPAPLSLLPGIPDTGQTSCYNNENAIFCPAPGALFYGQDFQYQPQHPRSYTKLGFNGIELPDSATQLEWLMTRDNTTGLIWEIKTTDNMNDTYTWANASAVFIAGLNTGNFAGFGDWRLPTVKELSSLVNSGTLPGIDTQWLPNMAAYYWTATEFLVVPGALGVDFGNGKVYYAPKDYSELSIAVRAGASGSPDGDICTDTVDTGRTIVNGNGTVTDTATGLMWQQETDAGSPCNWESALANAEDLVLAGYDDWRLPNRNEFQSIADYSQSSPAINLTVFPDTDPTLYWTSTTDLTGLNQAWRMNFNDGAIDSVSKTDSLSFRAVRGGQFGSLGDLAINGPAQGDRYAMGENLPIIWDPAGLGDNVKILLSRDGGASWEEIIASTPNDGNAGWTITGPATASAMLRIQDAAAPGAYQEIGFFSLGTVYNLFVTTTGTGSGSVTTIPAIINCPETSCTGVFPEDTMIQISAVAEPGSTFIGWFDGTGSAVDCSGTSSCSFTITEVSSIKAQFDANPIIPGDYYVDSVNGNDANDGTTSDTAWLSLHFAIGQVNAGSPGSYRLFVKSGIYQVSPGNEPDAALAITQDNVTVIGDGCSATVIDGAGTVYWLDGFDIQSASNVVLQNLEIMNFSGNGVAMSGAVDSVIETICVHNNMQNGIVIQEGMNSNPASGNIIRTGCRIYYNRSAGIYINDSADNQIIGNRESIYDNGISDGGYGIHIYGENAVNNDIINNHIHSTGNATYRQSIGIFLDNVGAASQIDVEQNLIESHPSYGIAIADSDCQVKRNRLIDNAKGVYVYAENGTEIGSSIWNNLIRSGSDQAMDYGIYLQMGEWGRITSGFTIYNNTIDGAVQDGVHIDATVLNDGTCAPRIYYNIISNSLNNGIENVNAIATVDNGFNDVFNSGVSDYEGCTPGTGSISSDPGYVIDGSDYHLDLFSPCVDASVGGVGPDMDGNPRPIDVAGINHGGTYDMGCYETIGYSISGHVSVGGVGLSGVTLNGLPAGLVTDVNGDYFGSVPPGWSGLVTPEKDGYTFTPVNRPYSDIQSDQTGHDYEATLITYTISGRVTEGGLGLSDVTMNGLPGSPVTDTSGYYSAIVDYGWSGTVAPVKTGYTFDPVNRIYTSVIADQTAQDYAANLNTYTISGAVTVGGFGLPGVTLSGLPGSPVTDTGGYYSAIVNYDWSGVVAPSKTGYTFNPINIVYSNITANQFAQDYAATLNTYIISGTVTAGGFGLPGVTMNGLPGSPVTDTSGFYSAVVDYNWSGTVIPGKTGYTFVPGNRAYADVTANQFGQDYTATLNTYTISGNVTESGTGLAGVAMNGLPGSPVTDTTGNYSAVVDYGWSGTVTPARTGYSFTPPNRPYTNVTGNQGEQNYAVTLNTYTISGTVTTGGAGLPGIIMNGLPGAPITDANGFYSAPVGHDWSGTVMPTKSGRTFNPSDIIYTNVAGNMTDQDYTSPLEGGNYYVDANAPTAGSGTQADPWQSLHAAIHYINEGSPGIYTLHVGGGIYQIGPLGHESDLPLQITQDNVAIIGDSLFALDSVRFTIIDGTDAMYWPNGIDIQSASGVTIQGIEILNFISDGIHMGAAVDCIVEFCAAHNNGNGIRIEPGGYPYTLSSGNIIRNGCEIYNNAFYGVMISDSFNNQVINNTGSIYDNGENPNIGIGILIQGPQTANNLIMGNDIYCTGADPDYTQYTGVSVFDTGSASANNDIIDNTISGHGWEGVRVYSAHANVKRNTLIDNSTGINLTADGEASNGINAGGAFWNNLIYDDKGTTGLSMINGITVIAKNGGQVLDATLYHNTIDGGTGDGVQFDITGGSVAANPEVFGNIITYFGASGINNQNGPGGLSISYNDVWHNGADGLDNYVGCIPGTGDLDPPEDPQYINRSAGNYTLQFGSPCIDPIPPATSPVLDDRDGIVRPQPAGGNWDMGAYEALEYMIAGQVTEGGLGLPGVTMNGLPGSPVTDTAGFYSAVVNHGWSGTVTPGKTGYAFTPPSRLYTNITGDQIGEDYTATLNAYTISGAVTEGGLGLSGVAMNGLPGSPVTNTSGYYSAVVDNGWSGTVTPAKTGHTFTPPDRVYSNVSGDQSEQDYTAVLNTYTISGQVTLGGLGLPGVAMSGLPGSPATDTGGYYSAVVNYGWSGTVTPGKTGYTFNPINLVYNTVSANQLAQDYAATLNTCTISGTVTEGGTGLAGVSLNGLPGSPVTDVNGSYSATVDYGWSGVVTPAKTGYTFLPVNRTYFPVIGDQTGQDYAATINTYTISGQVTLGGLGLPGVNMGGLSGSPMTDTGGYYSAVVNHGWSGTVTPNKAGYSFNPVNLVYANVAGNQLLQDYTATLNTYTISGTVTESGTGLVGVAMNGLPGSPVTDVNGSYSATVDYGWSGTVTPAKTGYTFTPPSRVYANVIGNQSAQNYAVTLNTYTISGAVTAGGAGLSGVTMNGLPGSPVTDANGFYSAPVGHDWSGAVTPILSGRTFNPANRVYSNVVADQTGQDYTSPLEGGDYYADADAPAAGSGTLLDPWQSLHTAIAYINEGNSGIYILHVGAGTYQLGPIGHEPDAPLQITQDNVTIIGDGVDTTIVEGAGTSLWQDGFDMLRASDIAIRDISVRNFTNDGIHMAAAVNCIVESCKIHSNGLNGVSIQDDDGTPSSGNIIRNGCEIYHNHLNGILINASPNNKVLNNQGSIYDNGRLSGGTGIAIEGVGAKDNLIQDNEIYYTATDPNYIQYTGISISNTGNGTNSNQILHNTISGHVRAEGIGLYSAYAGVKRNTLIDNNTGIYISADGAASNGARAGGAFWNNLIYDNKATANFTMIRGMVIDAVNNGQIDYPTLYHNTIDGGTGSGVLIDISGGSALTAPAIFANIITNCGESGINNENGPADLSLSYNDVWNNGADGLINYVGCAPGFADIVPPEDPRYIGPATGNFTLQAGSPCIDPIPPATSPVGDDLVGTPRPQPAGGNWDMGCYEMTQAAITHIITFNISGNTGGTLDGVATQVVADGADCTPVRALADTGYHFNGWTGDYAGSDNPLAITHVTADMTITANFAVNQYTVNFIAEAGGSITGNASQVVDHGASTTVVRANPDPGYEFVNWTGDFSGTVNALIIPNVTQNMTIYANFRVQGVTTYRVTFIAGAGGAIVGNNVQVVVNNGNARAVTALASAGYEFTGWTGDYTGTDNPLTLRNVTGNMIIRANFRQQPANVYTVRFIAGAGGSISGDAVQTVQSGQDCRPVTAVADPGYEFVDWTGHYTGADNPLTVSNVTGDRTIYANFRQHQIVTHTVSFIAGEGGSFIGNSSQIVADGADSSPVTAVADEGFEFIGWTGDFTGMTNPLAFVGVTTDLTVYANFREQAIVTHQVSFTAGDGGSLEGNASQTVQDGADATPVAAAPDEGFEFTGWTGDYTGTANPLILTGVVADMSVHANFRALPITHRVTFTPGEGGSLRGNTSQTVLNGDDCTPVTAVADSGYAFDGWTGDYMGMENPLTITGVTSDMSIAADFRNTAGNLPAQKPVLESPVDNVVLAEGPVELKAGPYSDPEGDTHVQTRWQVRQYGEPDPFFDEQSESDLTSYLVSAGFEPGLQYEWRAAYQDAGSLQYSWSDTQTFVVGQTQVDQNIPPVDPGIQMKDYKMVSFVQWPDDPSAEAVFGPMMGDDYNNKEFRIGTYDPTLGNGGYKEYPDFMVEPGCAYWFLARQGVDLTVSGVPVSTSMDICERLKFNNSSANGWNMIAPPNNANYRWGDLQVMEKDASGAIVFGPVAISELAADNDYIDLRIWQWSSGQYLPTDSADFLLEKYSGYWVRAKKANVYLCFPAAAQLAQITPMMMLAAWVTDVSHEISDKIYSIGAAYADISTDNPPLPMGGLDDGSSGGGSGSGCFISAMMREED